MLHGDKHRLKILPRRLLAAGQIDDERPGADARLGAGETALRRNAEALRAHSLRNAGRPALDHFERRLGRNITGRKARAAGRKHQIDAQRIRALDQLGLDLFSLVRDDGSVNDVPSLLAQNAADGGTARVDALSAKALVADGDDRCRVIHVIAPLCKNRRGRRRFSAADGCR